MKNVKWIVIGIIVIAAAAYPFIEQAKLDNTRTKLKEALSKNDFVNARAAAKILDEEKKGGKNTERVTYAEIGYLVNEGEFDMAYQIARENNRPDAYYDKVAPNLVSIYTKYGAAKTILALSTCVLPTKGEHWGEHLWMDSDECKIHYEKHNDYIKHLMECMKLSGDNESIAKVSIFLTTNYEGGTKDVNAIKAKFGL